QINMRDDYGWTALTYASLYNQSLGMMKLLLAHGAKVHIKDKHQETVLDLVSESPDETKSRLLRRALAREQVCGQAVVLRPLRRKGNLLLRQQRQQTF